MKNIIKTFAIFIVLLFGISVILLSYHIAGWRAFVVQSGSMEPALKTGALVISHQIPTNQLQKGNIITFIRPDKTSEFVTHRINQIKQNGKVTVIRTKGDNNKTLDNWQLAGGGVVGNVIFAIPYLGYIFDFSKTKIGILLLIIIPAIFIIYDELITIINLFKHKASLQKSGELAVLLFFIAAFATSLAGTPAAALLSDTALLQHNLIAVQSMPSNTGCTDSVTISNNGVGSTSTITSENPCPSISINQTNNSTIINTINFQQNTGDNKTQTSNTTVKTGEAANNVSIMTTLGSNNNAF